MAVSAYLYLLLDWQHHDLDLSPSDLTSVGYLVEGSIRLSILDWEDVQRHIKTRICNIQGFN
jgi:hypothetical protein